MFLKKKHISVIIFSSSIIAIVFISTLVGYHLYLQWKQDTLALKYRSSIYKLTAEVFKNDIVLSNVSIKTDKTSGIGVVPLLQGTIKNNSGKKITSILIEVSLIKPDGTVAYKEWVNPLGGGSDESGMNPSAVVYPEKILMPGEEMNFGHLLKNCPQDVKRKLSLKSEFAKEGAKGSLELNLSVAGMLVS
ncbi:MAG: hypothetical protein P9L90_00530 [Candidatus Aadella gelida]|nr:hypothetical protein [Candidatus Aadella gelida]